MDASSAGIGFFFRAARAGASHFSSASSASRRVVTETADTARMPANKLLNRRRFKILAPFELILPYDKLSPSRRQFHTGFRPYIGVGLFPHKRHFTRVGQGSAVRVDRGRGATPVGGARLGWYSLVSRTVSPMKIAMKNTAATRMTP